MAKRSCDRTTGVVLRGTESLLTHRWRGESTPADPTLIATLHDEAIAQMAIALRLITLTFGPVVGRNLHSLHNNRAHARH
jgi:hypothetical protein